MGTKKRNRRNVCWPTEFNNKYFMLFIFNFLQYFSSNFLSRCQPYAQERKNWSYYCLCSPINWRRPSNCYMNFDLIWFCQHKAISFLCRWNTLFTENRNRIKWIDNTNEGWKIKRPNYIMFRTWKRPYNSLSLVSIYKLIIVLEFFSIAQIYL